MGVEYRSVIQYEKARRKVPWDAVMLLVGRYDLDVQMFLRDGPRPAKLVNGPLTPWAPSASKVAEPPPSYAAGGRQRAMEARLSRAIQDLRVVLGDLERLSEELRGVDLVADALKTLKAGDEAPPPDEDGRETGSG